MTVNNEEKKEEKERERTMVTFRRTTFRDLGTTRARIPQLDRFLQQFSLPTLRSMQQDIQKDIHNAEEIARYRAILLRTLRNGNEIEDNFFLMRCCFDDIVLGEIEGELTSGAEWKWRGTWKKTYFDLLKPEQQAALLKSIKSKLDDINAENKYARKLQDYLQCYINGRNIQFDTFNELSSSITGAIKGFRQTFTLLLRNPFVEA